MRLMSVVVILLLAVATATDLRSRRVPDWVPVCLGLAAVTGVIAQRALAVWPLLAWGGVLGLGVGICLFAAGAMGGGDVKLLTALGLACGAPLFVFTLFHTAIAGGVLALVAAAAGRREIPYVPAISVGFAVAAWRAGVW